MKPIRNILIISGIIAVLAGGFYFVQKLEPVDKTQTPQISVSTVSVYKTDMTSITDVTVTLPDESFTISKNLNDNTWRVENNPQVKINQSRVETFLYECAIISAKELVAENVNDIAQYGLDAPQKTVLIKQQNGETVKVLIGNSVLEGTDRYLMLEGDTRVYLKSALGCESLVCSLSDLMDKTIYSMNADEVGGIILNRTGANSIHLNCIKTAEDEAGEPVYEWYMEKPLQKMASSYSVDDKLLPNIVSQTAEKIIPVPEKNFDYGFGRPRASYSLWSLDNTKRYNVLVGKEEGKNTYIKLVGDDTIYLVATETLDFISLGYLDLADKLIHLENIKDVSEIYINGLGHFYHLSISNKDGITAYSINDKPVSESKFKNAYKFVIGLTLDDFIMGSGAGKTAVTIRYIKHDGTETKVECLDYNDRNYLIKVNGKGNFLSRKKQVENMFNELDETISNQ
ncbi:MAG: DUF4340 domain-containing protein [Clostridia bacterium]|nr:DUF4340 domain-containing protein [Clostridia bacterium]